MIAPVHMHTQFAFIIIVTKWTPRMAGFSGPLLFIRQQLRNARPVKPTISPTGRPSQPPSQRYFRLSKAPRAPPRPEIARSDSAVRAPRAPGGARRPSRTHHAAFEKMETKMK